ncbi:MAG: thiol-disulfide oxidoreductase DCC family protein [Myxococcota bacterium]
MPVLLYDGDCGFCATSVQFVLRHDKRSRALRFAPLAGELGEQVRREHPELAGVDSMIWYEPGASAGTVRVRSEALLALLGYLGGGFRVLARLGRVVPRRLRDSAYAAFAARRKRFGGELCLMPTPEERARFLP